MVADAKRSRRPAYPRLSIGQRTSRPCRGNVVLRAQRERPLLDARRGVASARETSFSYGCRLRGKTGAPRAHSTRRRAIYRYTARSLSTVPRKRDLRRPGARRQRHPRKNSGSLRLPEGGSNYDSRPRGTGSAPRGGRRDCRRRCRGICPGARPLEHGNIRSHQTGASRPRRGACALRLEIGRGRLAAAVASMRIAIIKLGALGDVLRTTALLPALKRLGEEVDITWITETKAFPLLQGNPALARIVDWREKSDWRGTHFDWVISLDDDGDPARLASELSCDRLSGAFEDSAGQVRYTDDVGEWFGMGRLRPSEQGGLSRANEIKRMNQRSYDEILYRMLKLPPPVERPFLAIPEEARQWARGWTTPFAGAPFVGLNTGAGGRWRFKSWSLEQTAALAREIGERLGATAVILGGIAETERNAAIVSAAHSTRVVAAPCDLSLARFAAMIARTDVLVSSDSLAMHIGIALERPVIAFFGPTSSAEINLHGAGEKIVTPLACRCCYLPDCDVRPDCMRSIGIDIMLDAVRRWLPRQTLALTS